MNSFSYFPPPLPQKMASDNDDTKLKQYERTMEEWIKIVDTILEKKPGFLRMRYTDHEFRTDERDIVSLDGKTVILPVDSLPYNVEKDWKHLKKMLDCYANIVGGS
jgi:hypothetical protein